MKFILPKSSSEFSADRSAETLKCEYEDDVIHATVWLSIALIVVTGCAPTQQPVTETDDGFLIDAGQSLTINLAVPLSSNKNRRGDSFSSHLANDVSLNQKKIVLPKETEIRGLVTQVNKWNRLGDRAGLVLAFDQIVLKDGSTVPLNASLDTRDGAQAIRIQGREIRDAKVVGTGAIIGALAGRTISEEDGARRGMLIGATVGTGAVLLSNAREVSLPVGTQIKIRLDSALLIPK